MDFMNWLVHFFFDWDECSNMYKFRFKRAIFLFILILIISSISIIAVCHYVPREVVFNESISYNDSEFTFNSNYEPLVPVISDTMEVYLDCPELGFNNQKLPYRDGGCSYTIDIPKNVTNVRLDVMCYETGFFYGSEHIIYNVKRV